MIIPVELVRKLHDAALEKIDQALADVDALDKQQAAGLVGLAQKLHRLDLVLPHRERLIPILQQGQDPETGDFPHEAWHVWLVPVLSTMAALRVLGATLKYPVRELERILSSDDALRDWVDALDWSHPWGGATGAGHSMIGFTYAA